MLLSVYVPLCIVLICILGPMLKGLVGIDRVHLFSPMVFSGIVFFYYIVVSVNKITLENIFIGDSISMILWATAIFMISYLFAFQVRIRNRHFRKINKTYLNNPLKLSKRAIVLFLIGFIAYVGIKGFTFSIFQEQEYAGFDPNDSYGHTTAYITYLIALCPTAICLMYASRRKKIFVYIMMLFYIMIVLLNGTRYLLAVLLLLFGTFYHLYPSIKKVNWIKVFLIGAVFYASMGIIEFTRNYGSGLDINKLESLERDRVVEGASEGLEVFLFSATVMEIYDKEDFIYFEPLANAMLMPIPRRLFPNKPKGEYMRDANMKVHGDISRGSAFLNITEAYISFGWLGIIIYGLLFGALSKVIWSNYLANRTLGSILLLASFNAWIYIFISRGYMAQAFLNFMYFVIVPFCVSWLLDAIYNKEPLSNNNIYQI